MANTPPSRKTSDADVNMLNHFIRQQPWYQEWFTAKGIDPNKASLSRGAQSQLESLLKSKGLGLPSGMHIDQAGNVNQKNRTGRNAAIIAGMAGLAATGLGAAGIGPLAGALGGGAAAAGGAGAGGLAAAGGGAAIPTIGSTALTTGLGTLAPTVGSSIAGGIAPAAIGGAAAAGGGAATGGGAAAGGGTLTSRILNASQRVAPIVGGMATANAANRANENDQARLREQADLERFKVNQGLPDNRLASAVQSSRVSRAKPVNLQWGGVGSGRRPDGGVNISGGYNDDLVGDDTRRLADDVVAQRLNEQLNRQQAPTTADPEKESTADKIIGGIATGTAVAGAIPKPPRKYYSPTYAYTNEV